MRTNQAYKNRVTSRGGKRSSIIAACMLFGVLLIQLSVRLSITDRAYRLEELRESILAKDTLLRETRLDLARTIDPIFLKKHARQRLSMGVTPPQRIRRIDIGSKQ